MKQNKLTQIKMKTIIYNIIIINYIICFNSIILYIIL